MIVTKDRHSVLVIIVVVASSSHVSWIVARYAASCAAPVLRCGDDALLLLWRELLGSLLQRMYEEWYGIRLEVLGVADLVQVLCELLCGALEVEGIEVGLLAGGSSLSRHSCEPELLLCLLCFF